MNKNILLLISLLFTLANYGQSANTSTSSKKMISATFNSQAIKAYQESAVVKIKDYYHYMELYSNETNSDSLQIQLKKTIHHLFINPNELVIDFTSSENEQISLSKLLEKIKRKNYTLRISGLENSIVAQDFWTTKYNLEVNEGLQRCSIEIYSKVIFMPIQKKFGSKTKEVWTLFLGEME